MKSYPKECCPVCGFRFVDSWDMYGGRIAHLFCTKCCVGWVSYEYKPGHHEVVHRLELLGTYDDEEELS